jgi:hypothetical protein
MILLLYFFIGFISDLILNYLSQQSYAPASIKSLNIYFKRPGIKIPFVRDMVSAINAGLTIVVAILITMFLSHWIFNFYHPHSLKQLASFLLLAFPIGYIMDIVIYKTELFGPTLNPFYKIAGAGFWGAGAFIFSIMTSYFLSKYIKKL